MEPTLALVTDGGALAWSVDKNMPSNDGAWDAMVLPSPSPTEVAWRGVSMTAPIQTGQLSPVSSGMDVTMEGSSGPTTAHSASSSSTDSWSIGYVERDDGDEDARWDHWERSSDDALIVPKLEPAEDELNLNDLKAAPLTPGLQGALSNGSQVKQKRPRGRPRKHPLAPAVSASKVTKGRSKTGCITCRKRKKKCDEAKPRCMNCEKNAVVCEGYHEKQIWKSGRERIEEGTSRLAGRRSTLTAAAERLKRECLPSITMQPIFHGVETIEDKIFWKHYVNHFSNVLTVEGEAKNAFKDIILQLAHQHQGLMHSILSLSSKHIDFDSPCGSNVLQENPTASRESLQQRAEHHHCEAFKRLNDAINKPVDKDDPEYQTALAAHYGQILCLLLGTRAEGNPRGEHRFHLQAYQKLFEGSPPENTAFYTFIAEFFQYHIYADDLFWCPETMADRLSSEHWEPSIPIPSPRLLGVADGLFQYLSQITSIRNTVRANMAASVDPPVDYITLFRAVDIDAAIRDWAPRWPPGDSRDHVAPLYKQMMWVYLFRTIYPPSTSPQRRSTLGSLPVAPASPAAMTPQRRASMVASVGSGAAMASTNVSASGTHMPRSCPSSRNPSRTHSMHELDTQAANGRALNGHRRSSPPPIRRPAHDDRRITLAVEESLSILESFKPFDPAQTLLLIPCLIIGTACFESAQRDRICTAVKVVRGYTGLRSCDRVVEVLGKVWSLMDEGNWIAAWDWQGVAREMGLDFICA
ncbi:Transcriptional regulatory protein moc3 [Tolypocladium ophioglossoides CBS 100239]|uniref:Transcriptional regulatory protein moc3 n=1 Tax=Tolypocladium ophioglossoides (strain CBS 100239) TaxID=1163406 RepID=A0A0L0NGZ1_TOLOC|nr:Transcriptional regulatory protein moc3 [Tolypocladium ophioglossoides CBS 100239]